jgi:hypothetical protein
MSSSLVSSPSSQSSVQTLRELSALPLVQPHLTVRWRLGGARQFAGLSREPRLDPEPTNIAICGT